MIFFSPVEISRTFNVSANSLQAFVQLVRLNDFLCDCALLWGVCKYRAPVLPRVSRIRWRASLHVEKELDDLLVSDHGRVEFNTDGLCVVLDRLVSWVFGDATCVTNNCR